MRYFKPSEFDCRCRRGLACGAAPMQAAFLDKLEALREHWGQSLSPTSARRCRYYNDKLKGSSPSSEHMQGNACDFWFESPSDTMAFVAMAEKFGFAGIGHGKHLVHIDNREHTARWTYSNK